ncbi:hypothetical protein [Weizmannia acidilactici]|uniref:hypothetical protein n=1 Tax=Weizmannia acidilactici TaxID=2607726 RepID=UPI00124E59FE|nr:hypothetical protein [Weizmannia acidilactici]
MRWRNLLYFLDIAVYFATMKAVKKYGLRFSKLFQGTNWSGACLLCVLNIGLAEAVRPQQIFDKIIYGDLFRFTR